MKFGKSLSNQIEETLPEWRDKFLSYKDLKKKLKLVQPKSGDTNRPSKKPKLDSDADAISNEVIDFITLLEKELEKFNSFFVEKEEEYIIRLKVFLFRFVSFLLKLLLKISTEALDFVHSTFWISVDFSFLIRISLKND